MGRGLPASFGFSRVAAFFTQPINLIFTGVAGIIAFLAFYPSFFLLYGSLTDAPLGVPGHFTFHNYVQAYSDPTAYRLILTSFIFGIGASGFSIVVDYRTSPTPFFISPLNERSVSLKINPHFRVRRQPLAFRARSERETQAARVCLRTP